MLFRVSIADQFLFTVPRHDSGLSIINIISPIWASLHVSVTSHPGSGTAARGTPPAPGTRADRDRRGAPPPGIPPGSAPRPLAPRLRRARAPSPPGRLPTRIGRGAKRARPAATRVAHTHAARPRIRSIANPKPASAARGACVVARGGIDGRGRGQERHAVPPPAGHARSTTRPRFPSRVSIPRLRDNAHTDTAHASVHTPHPTRADRAAPLRCGTARRIDTHSIDTQHSALRLRSGRDSARSSPGGRKSSD
jgi:hypothetical protein